MSPLVHLSLIIPEIVKGPNDSRSIASKHLSGPGKAAAFLNSIALLNFVAVKQVFDSRFPAL